MELSLIAEEACLLLSSLTRMIRPMEDEGLVTRRTPKEDRRKTVIAITKTGERLVRDHSDRSAAIFRRIEHEFGSERLEQLLDLLQDLQEIDLRTR
jgi:DNA-binding MarR family transcriptional regulator